MKIKTSVLLAAVLTASSAFALESVDKEIFKIHQPAVVAADETATSVVTIGDSIRVNGTVEENAVAVGGDIYIGPMGVIKGDAVAVGGNVIREPGSVVSGKTTAFPWSVNRVGKGIAVAVPAMAVGLGAVLGAAIIFGSLGSIALALIVLILFPGQITAAREQILGHPLRVFLMGIFVLTMTLPVLVFLAITIVGIPLAFMAAALVMATLILGTVAVGQWIGLRLLSSLGRGAHPVLAGFLGLLIITLAVAVPVAGILVQAFVVCFALGSVTLSRFRSVPSSARTDGI